GGMGDTEGRGVGVDYREGKAARLPLQGGGQGYEDMIEAGRWSRGGIRELNRLHDARRRFEGQLQVRARIRNVDAIVEVKTDRRAREKHPVMRERRSARRQLIVIFEQVLLDELDDVGNAAEQILAEILEDLLGNFSAKVGVDFLCEFQEGRPHLRLLQLVDHAGNTDFPEQSVGNRCVVAERY